jgi:hypothetical protein
VRWAALYLDVNWIVHASVRHIIDRRIVAQQTETWHNLGEFLDGFEMPEDRSLITEAAAEDRTIPNPEIQLADVVLKLRNQHLEHQIASLTQKVSQPETADADKVQLLQQQQQLRAQKRSPLATLEK